MTPHFPAPTSHTSVSAIAVVLGAQVIRDDAANRTILLLVIALAILGLVLLGFTLWFWRTSRPEHPSLAPLEVMGSRRFWKRDAVEQIQLLDDVRPEGAEPERSVAHALLPHGPRPERRVDLQQASRSAAVSFDDLSDAQAAANAEPKENVQADDVPADNVPADNVPADKVAAEDVKGDDAPDEDAAPEDVEAPSDDAAEDAEAPDDEHRPAPSA